MLTLSWILAAPASFRRIDARLADAWAAIGPGVESTLRLCPQAMRAPGAEEQAR
jgi:hypothetical protein